MNHPITDIDSTGESGAQDVATEFADLNQFLNLARGMTHKCFERRSAVRDLCPMLSRSQEERREALQLISGIEKDISEIHSSMLALERAHKCRVGVSALIGATAANDRAVYTATALMAMSRLSVSVADEISTVGALLEKAAFTPLEALHVREACSESGALHKWIRLSNAFNLDFSILEFSDRAFSICVGKIPSRRELAQSILQEPIQPTPRNNRRLPF